MKEPRVPSHYPFFVKLERGKSYAWCACGRSATQPFCDGSHAGTGIEPCRFRHEGASHDFSLCGCKHTARPPHCDGAHQRLMAHEDQREDAMELRFPAGEPIDDGLKADCEIGPCIPDLPVVDAPAAIRHYAEVLGFTKVFDDAVVGYDHTMFACMERGEFRVTLDQHRAAEVSPPVQLSCTVSDVDALHKELVARGAKIVEGPLDQVWHSRDIVIEDLDGHRLRFTTPLSRGAAT
ncbi:MAG: CDGSH iron-sulfur domain-containing protein [Planctomycetota bacterium]